MDGLSPRSEEGNHSHHLIFRTKNTFIFYDITRSKLGIDLSIHSILTPVFTLLS